MSLEVRVPATPPRLPSRYTDMLIKYHDLMTQTLSPPRPPTHGVVLPMCRGLPQFDVVDVGRDDLLEAAPAVLGADKLHQRGVDVRTARLEETRARGELVEEEQLLLLWGGGSEVSSGQRSGQGVRSEVRSGQGLGQGSSQVRGQGSGRVKG